MRLSYIEFVYPRVFGVTPSLAPGQMVSLHTTSCLALTPNKQANSPAMSVEAAAEVDLQLRILPGAIRASAQRTRAQAAMLLGPRSVVPLKGGPRDPSDVLEEAVRASTLCP